MSYEGQETLSIRGAGGFGDAVYIYPIVKYYAEAFEKRGKKRSKITLFTNFNDIYEHLGITMLPHKRIADINATYTMRRHFQDTDQYTDIIIHANLPKIPLEIDWALKNYSLVKSIKDKARDSKKKTVCMIASPHSAFGDDNTKAMEMVPDFNVLQKIINIYKKEVYFIQCGYGRKSFELMGIDLDLHGVTKTSEVMDIATVCDVFLTQPGFPVPIAQAYNKYLFMIFSHKIKTAQNKILRFLMPPKYIRSKKDIAIFDNEPIDLILGEFKRCLNG